MMPILLVGTSGQVGWELARTLSPLGTVHGYDFPVLDLASPEAHPLAKTGKDVAAGGVLIAAIASVLVGLIVLGPPLWERVVSGKW